MEKPATTDATLLEPIRKRWSPRAFSEQTVSDEILHEALEAARWAPSCYNEQPWRFLVFDRQSEYRPIVESCLTGGNAWAKAASHLLVIATSTCFSKSQKPNRYAYYDTGAAALSLVLEAQSRGVSAHQMAGFDLVKLEQSLGLPQEADIIAVMALGYASEDTSQLPEHQQEKEQAPRQRKPLAEIVKFNQDWGF